MSNIEDNFVTHDMDSSSGEPVEVSFNMIEDESGDIFWGYGHQDANEFIDEVNRWLVHVGAITDPDDFLFPQHHTVEHLYAKMTTDERFEIVDYLTELNKSDAPAFPVTRLML